MNSLSFFFFSLFTCFVNFLHAADDAAPPPSREQGFMQTLIMIGVALLFFYFILWRPEQRRRKALEEQRKALKKGDRVAAMGIIGIVAKVNDNTVIIRMFDGSKLEFLKAAITDLLPESDSKEASKDTDKDATVIIDDAKVRTSEKIN